MLCRHLAGSMGTLGQEIFRRETPGTVTPGSLPCACGATSPWLRRFLIVLSTRTETLLYESVAPSLPLCPFHCRSLLLTDTKTCLIRPFISLLTRNCRIA